MTKRALLKAARQMGNQDLCDLAEYSTSNEQRAWLALSEMARFLREGRYADAFVLGRAVFSDGSTTQA